MKQLTPKLQLNGESIDFREYMFSRIVFNALVGYAATTHPNTMYITQDSLNLLFSNFHTCYCVFEGSRADAVLRPVAEPR